MKHIADRYSLLPHKKAERLAETLTKEDGDKWQYTAVPVAMTELSYVEVRTVDGEYLGTI